MGTKPATRCPGRRAEAEVMAVVSLTAALAFAAISPPPSPLRAPIKITSIDQENFLVSSSQPIDQVYIDDMYENTDYMLEQDAQNLQVRVRMLTSRGPLKVIVETIVPGAKGLRRKHVVVIANPAGLHRGN
jgi:hypothetical protein